MLTPSRRLLLSLAAASAAFPGVAVAADRIGEALEAKGNPTLHRAAATTALQANAALFEGDMVRTEGAGFATLELMTATRINLGPDSEITLDRFVANLGGEITIGGPLVFDRAEDLPKIDLSLRSRFAQIGVRGTRFFAGPSNGVYAVFVDRGEVSVTAGGVERVLRAGDGVNVPDPDQPPTDVVKWGQGRIDAAFASVGL